MPNLPKSRQRPWIPKKPQHLREVDNASFYNSKRWRALRNYYIQTNPLCAQCKRDNKVTAAQCVDHVKAISIGGSMVDINNLQSLCNNCHNKKSAREAVDKRGKIKTYDRKK